MPEKTLENWEWRKMFFIELDEFPQFTEASVKIRIHRCTWQSRWKGHCKTWKDACSCSVHARIFSTKTAMTTSEEDDDASYWHAIFTKTVAKHLSSYSPGLTATPLYTFYDLFGIRGEAANPTICYVLSHSWLLIWELEIRGIFRWSGIFLPSA